MDEVQTGEIRFFDTSSRIGRLRYFAYGMGVVALLLPALVLAAILAGLKLMVLSGLLLIACYIFMLTMSIVFGVRRLHDLGQPGWWMLISPVAVVISLLGIFQLLGGLTWLSPLVSLISLVFYLVLLFWQGTQGDNRFGPPPPPNSGWVVFGAWSFLIVPFFGGILAAIAIPAYQDYIARSQTSEGIQLAGGAEVGVSEYFKTNKAWPASLSMVYATADQHPAGRFVASVTASVSPDGSSYGIISTMKTEGVNRMIAGTAVEIWTNDGGDTWHCGPASSNPVEPKYLPASCRESSPPPP